jgi:hypothetical protein
MDKIPAIRKVIRRAGVFPLTVEKDFIWMPHVSGLKGEPPYHDPGDSSNRNPYSSDKVLDIWNRLNYSI